MSQVYSWCNRVYAPGMLTKSCFPEKRRNKQATGSFLAQKSPGMPLQGAPYPRMSVSASSWGCAHSGVSWLSAPNVRRLQTNIVGLRLQPSKPLSSHSLALTGLAAYYLG